MPHIFLYGPPGSGKSTLGSMLADSLRLPFIDLDEAIQSKAGMCVPQIMQERGEEAFRDLETAALMEKVHGPDRVIALGGGTLLRAENRVLAEQNGQVVCLRVKQPVLIERLQAEANQRPLLSGNLDEKLEALLAARGEHYNSFDQQLEADQMPEEIVQQLEATIGRFHLSAMGSYDVLIQPGGLDELGRMLNERGISRPLVVSDENVARLHSARVIDSLRCSGHNAQILVIPAGEASKTINTVSRLWLGFIKAGLDRKSTIVALGGGVVGDLAGFAASTFMRAIDWVCLPTTVLSMVDASIGGKTGFDLAEGKNLVGSFHAPRLVLADPNVLTTLTEDEFRAGLAEVVKHGLVGDPALLDLCAHGVNPVRQNLLEVVRRAVAVKVKLVESDPYEADQRAALNLGHTVGHAVELVSEFRIRHGEAVAMGMVVEARLAERLGIARKGLSGQIIRVLSSLGLPVRIPQDLPRPQLIKAMLADKKKANGIVRFALPVEIGQVQVNVEVKDLARVFEED